MKPALQCRKCQFNIDCYYTLSNFQNNCKVISKQLLNLKKKTK